MPADPLLLAVDTSSDVVSAAVVAVSEAEVRVVASKDEPAANRHGERLTSNIDELLDRADVRPSALTAVAAGVGPGPFTGLRVGVVTASSLADALGVPSYAACSLDAIARANTGGQSIVVCTDARRRQVYWARYDEAGARVEGPDIATAADVAARFAGQVPVAVGAGVVLYPTEFAAFDQVAGALVSAVDVARLAVDRVRQRAPTEVLEPLYLRRPDATPPGRPKPVLPA